MPTRLTLHEQEVARRVARTWHGRALRDRLQRFMGTPTGNFLANTPIFLLPKHVHLRGKHRVLEVGCGSGANLRFLATRVRFRAPPVGLDLSRDALASADDGAFVRVMGSASRLPFADASFDLILAGHVVRHLSEEGLMRLMLEAMRVLRPGGILALWEYAPPGEGRAGKVAERLLEPLGKGRLRDFGRLVHLASEAGFDLVEEPPLRPFLLPPLPHVAILARKAAPADEG